MPESEERYRALVENAPLGVIVRTGEKIVFANPAAAQLLGAAGPHDLIGRDAIDMFASEDRADVLSHRQITEVEGRSSPPVERRLIRLDGGSIHAIASAAPVIFDGKPSIQIILRDTSAEHAAREALQKSEEQFRRTIDGMNEGLLLLDADGRINFANDRMPQIVGWTTSEIIGRDSIELVATPESRDILDRHRRARREGVSDRYEVMLRRKSGEEFFAEVSGAPLFLDGDFAGSIVLIYDISKRKRAEIALRENEETFRRLLDSMPTYVFSTDFGGHFLAVNATFCRALRRTAEEIVGRTGPEIGLTPETVRQWRIAAATVRETADSQTVEIRVPADGPAVRTIRFTVSPLRDSSGAVIGVSGIGVDVTEQKAAEESVQKLMRAVEQLEEVMFITDRNGIITYVNPAFQRIYGYSREEAIGQTPRLLKSGEILPEQYRQMWNEILAGRSTKAEYVNRTANGSLVRVIASITPLTGEDGQVNGFVCIQEDVTERRRAEDEQRRLQERMDQLTRIEALGNLAGGIAHDFNNILSIILSHTTVIERAHGDQQRIQKAIGTVKQAVQRGSALSKQILTFARRTERRVQPLEIFSLVREIQTMIAETFPRNIHIETEVEENLPLIVADSSQIHQALLNLAVNARDAMPSGGTLNISADLVSRPPATAPGDPPRDYLRVTVADTGAGIPPSIQEHLFEPFFTTKESGKGTGLGLSVVYGVVQAHGGFIEVDSAPGRGTEFRIYLPPSN